MRGNGVQVEKVRVGWMVRYWKQVYNHGRGGVESRKAFRLTRGWATRVGLRRSAKPVGPVSVHSEPADK